MRVHYADYALFAFYGTLACYDRIIKTCTGLKTRYFSLIIGEVNGVKAGHILIVFPEAVLIHGNRKAFSCAYSAVVAAGGAYPFIACKFFGRAAL